MFSRSQCTLRSFEWLGMTLTKSRSAALAAERSETPSPQKKMVGRGFRSWYGAVARDLSWPKPDSGWRNCGPRRRVSREGVRTREDQVSSKREP